MQFTKLIYSFIFLTTIHNTIAQVHPTVFFPITNGYNFAKQGIALLNNGDTIQGKFQYHKPLFNKSAQIRFFANYNKRRFIKYKLTDIKQISFIGNHTKNIYVFILVNDKLVSISNSNTYLNHNTLRKLK
jgi:hypothetical protein